METWPGLLPNPSTGYALNPVDPVVRSDVEQGPARSRRRFTSAPTKAPVTWKLNKEQFAIFEAFHHYRLNDGAAWFNVNIINGQGLTLCEARFSKMWQAKAAGNRWRVTAELEIRNRPLMTAAELTGLIG